MNKGPEQIQGKKRIVNVVCMNCHGENFACASCDGLGYRSEEVDDDLEPGHEEGRQAKPS